MAVSGSFNLALVLLSLAIATGASFTALDLAGTGRADSGSLAAAIELAVDIVARTT